MHLLWVDVVRSIAIVFVIFIHSSGAVLPASPYPISNTWLPIIFHILARTGVPMFIMISGALLLGKQESTPQFFQKRIAKVLIPWVFWTFIYIIYLTTTGRSNPATLSEWKYLFEMVFLSQYWFLPVIFILYLLIPLFRLAIVNFRNFHYLYLSLIWFIFVSILPQIHPSPAFPSSSQPGLFISSINYSGFLFLGFYFSRLNYQRKHLRIAILGLILGQLLSFIQLFTSRLQSPNPYQFMEYFSPGIIVSSLSLYVLIIILITQFKHNFSHKYFAMVGKASFGIFLIHNLIINLLIVPVFTPTHFLQSIALTMVVFLLSLSLVLVLSKSKAGNYLVP